MSILVVCPGCRKSFQVNDKFAGKTGPCPQCKTKIKVPEKTQEVQVHAPEEFATGGRSTTGKLVTKPVARAQVKLEPMMAATAGAGIVGLLVITWAAGKIGLAQNIVPCGLGLLLISPLLSFAGYTFLRDDELEPYRGRELWLRLAACSVAYSVLWGIFAFMRNSGLLTEDLFSWMVFAPPVFLLGTGAAWAALDLEFGNAFMHYTFYIFVTIVLRWVADLGWIWNPA
ncbi:MAG: hypothetical protein ABSG68_10055 [Thermoguttaceae bacterium]|jgi:hypothetical protein